MKLDVKHMDFDWESPGEALAGLSSAAVVSLMDDYYNTYKKVGDIFKEYGVTGDIRRIASEFPLRCLDEKCPYDGSRLVKRMPARSMSDRFFAKVPSLRPPARLG